MLMIEMVNPIQLTIVNAVPLFSTGAYPETMEENCGESIITVIPQKRRKGTTTNRLLCKSIGENRQHNPEEIKANKATLRLLIFIAQYPPRIHAILPTAMIRKENVMTEPVLDSIMLVLAI